MPSQDLPTSALLLSSLKRRLRRGLPLTLTHATSSLHAYRSQALDGSEPMVNIFAEARHRMQLGRSLHRSQGFSLCGGGDLIMSRTYYRGFFKVVMKKQH